MTTRSARRARVREEMAAGPTPEPNPTVERLRAGAPRLARVAAFAVIALVIVGGGVYAASSVFLGARGKDAPTGALPVRISMAGWDPKTIDVRAGQAISLHFWDTDSAMHLSEMDPGSGGVHTFIMDDQHVRVAIPGEGSKDYTLTAPSKPGDYDFYCDTCCGGKGSPDMHGTLHVTA